ncbi:hypothetical protein [Persicobacter diffluens]|uniref:G8 domain-containing protein n=1 Tax=Persicobacter diffluens TaxID=981 RepID=A0AAN4VYD6_9BACT|nr:hypothetical protein PEDI_20710 [Persicobacter diffluens]
MGKRLLLFLFCCLPMVGMGQTVTWTGADDGWDWSNPLNWNESRVPSISENVEISDVVGGKFGTQIFIEDSQTAGGENAFCKDLILGENVTLYIGSKDQTNMTTLTIEGNFNLNGGEVVSYNPSKIVFSGDNQYLPSITYRDLFLVGGYESN